MNPRDIDSMWVITVGGGSIIIIIIVDKQSDSTT